MNIPAFAIAALPEIVFGDGVRRRLPELAARYGRRALVVTGARSFIATPHWTGLQDGLRQAGLGWEQVSVSGEPAPQQMDGIARHYRSRGIDVVIGIGGGSVLDAAKAIAGLLRIEHSVMDFLEGVGPELP